MPPQVVVSPVVPFDAFDGEKCGIKANGEKKAQDDYISPIKALWLNFRFNQLMGTFPFLISNDWYAVRFIKKGLILWLAVRAIFVAVILTLLYFWLKEQVTSNENSRFYHCLSNFLGYDIFGFYLQSHPLSKIHHDRYFCYHRPFPIFAIGRVYVICQQLSFGTWINSIMRDYQRFQHEVPGQKSGSDGINGVSIL